MNSSPPNPVPRLDLAPKLRRPLSLWNPLDYLRLLYWVFFFPQALRWYLDTFGGGHTPPRGLTWRERIVGLLQNRIQRQLFLQNLFFIAVIPCLIARSLESLGVNIDWEYLVYTIAICVFLTIVGSMTVVGVGFATIAVAFSITSGIIFGIVGIVSIVGNVRWGVLFLGIAFGVLFSVVTATESKTISTTWKSAVTSVMIITLTLTFAMAVIIVIGVASLLIFNLAFIVSIRVATAVIILILFGVIATISFLRAEAWLLAFITTSFGRLLIPAITPIPLLRIFIKLKIWLRQDWDTGLHNANQLLAYSLQFIPVVKAVNQVLREIPSEHLFLQISQLAQAPYDWDLVRFASAPLIDALKKEAIDGIYLFPRPLKQYFTRGLILQPRLNTPARAAAAGFWYLHEKQPESAEQAFAVVRDLPYGEELYTLAWVLAQFKLATDLAAIAHLSVPNVPSEPWLRPTSWAAMTRLFQVVEAAQQVQRSASRASRAFALSRALGELQAVLDQADTLPQAEQALIEEVSLTWQAAFLAIAAEVGEVEVQAAIRNPYVIGAPVQGRLFVGRDDILRQLEELWEMGNQLQSVVLYGHRRMGKTSILLNVASHLGSGVKVAYVNLLLSASATNITEVLLSICDKVSQVMQLPAPSDSEMIQLPLVTFQRYLKQVMSALREDQGLIIALDEFEKIEELITAGKIPSDFMAVLRGLVQMSPRLGFVFAGLHTLDEMTADYFHPFFASVISLRVSFLSKGATRELLANPHEDFPLDYLPAALDLIWSLTQGQPYLTQLVGFQLVHHYNTQRFEQNRQREPVFTVKDVETVVDDPDFFKRGHYYFTGFWSQAGRDVEGQQMILKALASHAAGLTLPELSQAASLDTGTLHAALEVLQRYDVVQEREGQWAIAVELFRRWLLLQMAEGAL